MSRKTSIGVLTRQIQKDALNRVQIFPAGEFRAEDGRPFDAPFWLMNRRSADRLIEQAAKKKNDFVIDYEHQTLNAAYNGMPAPASGWCKNFSFDETDGYWIEDSRWTAQAKTYIQNDEYRYVSPVFRYDAKTGEVLELLHIALTNDPALDGMSDVGSWAQAKFSHDHPNQEEFPMKKLIAALKLQPNDDATPEEIEDSAVAAIEALQTKASGLEGEVAALKKQEPDPTKFAPIAALTKLQQENNSLKKEKFDDECDKEITAALTAKKLTAAEAKWAREDQNWESVAALKSWLETKVPNPALEGQGSSDVTDDGDNGNLTEAELAVCKSLGMTQEDFLKAKGSQKTA